MISRRNIRVKVMQTLYSIGTLEGEQKQLSPEKVLDNHFAQTKSLFTHLVWSLTSIFQYAETYARQRASKHLPTAEDLNVNTKLAGNSIIMKIIEDEGFLQKVESEKPDLRIEPENIRKIYLQLVETPEYNKYINISSREKKDELEMVEFVFDKMMINNENYISLIEDLFTNWNDDGEMIIQLVMNYIQKPTSFLQKNAISKEKLDFGHQLLKTVINKDEHLQELIVPKLKNWDPERIAYLDMLMMKMGIAEFLYFETIPPKVTINEYIDLAKEYSTLQSGQFVNGILDNVHKDLVEQNKLHKVSFKKD